MHSEARSHNSIFGVSWSPANAALAIMLTLLFLIFLTLFITLTAQPAQGQTFNVLYHFTGGTDGSTPYAGLTPDGAGNFYGTAYSGGTSGLGTVFKLVHERTGWALWPLYSFQGYPTNDGGSPMAGVVIGPDGVLYGTNIDYGGGTGCEGNLGCGTVFSLSPPAVAACHTIPCPWTETVLHRFSEDQQGAWPFSEVTFDQAGNLYGTTFNGGIGGCGFYGVLGCGVVYELTRSSGGWTESVLYAFTGGSDGGSPWAGVIFDQAGNLYGTTVVGTVFQLTHSGSGWTENVLHSLRDNDGAIPVGCVIFDQSGNLYGTASWAGSGRYSFHALAFER